MNNRTRQWMKAYEALNKHDPLIWGVTSKGNILVIFHKSELEKVKEKYGEHIRIHDLNEEARSP